MEYETSFDFCNVPIGVTYELDVYDREPYSWGGSRGTETDVIVLSVFVGETDIMPMLPESTVEEIAERIKENLE